LTIFAAVLQHNQQFLIMHLSEQEIIRREKLKELEKLGINSYPAPLYPVNITAATIKSSYKGEENKDEFKDVCLAGRIMSIRDMGKASFAVLQDSSGRIQLYIKRDDICPGEDKTLYDKVWKHLMDIGDIIGVKGFVFTTRTGEISVHVTELTLLSKSLKRARLSTRLPIPNSATASVMPTSS
jgi:lysyl-tRNA synthetase class 2